MKCAVAIAILEEKSKIAGKLSSQ